MDLIAECTIMPPPPSELLLSILQLAGMYAGLICNWAGQVGCGPSQIRLVQPETMPCSYTAFPKMSQGAGSEPYDRWHHQAIFHS